MNAKTKEVSVVEQQQEIKQIQTGVVITPMHMLERAYEQKADVATLERLFDLKTKVEADDARKAYHIAMASFKRNPPKVLKDKVNTQYGSKYAGIGNLVNTVSIALGSHGITASFDQDNKSSPVSVTCTLTHESGHSESTTMFGDADNSGAKNSLQKIKSTMTYLRSSTFESITGIIASDDGDDDGNGSADEFISTEQVQSLRELLERTKADVGQVLKYAKADQLDEILMSDYGKVSAAVANFKAQS